MSEPYLGEIRCFGFNFAPLGWALCDGRLLPIAENDALFTILGTTYGGDGNTNFGLPNLSGRIPMHWGNPQGRMSTLIGQSQGDSTATLGVSQIPAHRHPIVSEMVAPGGVTERTATPSGSAFIGPSNPDAAYKVTNTLDAGLSAQIIGRSGGSQPHENMQPYLVVNFCIALQGIYPSQN
jgi:microcystin-dependent protein